VAEIILDHIVKRYPDGALAVDDFNLDIADGEFVILVGPSGCGKSTTLNMIAGLEDITSGDLRIGGQIVNNKSPKDRDIAMVFQSYALYPHMTVRENMGFALKLAKTPQATINEKVEEAARILDLTQHLDRRPANLSGGQRQRVAMGRAIVRDPAVFLMDEPLSNLDAKLRVQMRAEIARLQRHLEVTTIYVTHDQIEAMTMGDRVAVIRKGELQQVDPPQVLYDHPNNLFVAGFIGSPAMNMVEASLARSDGALTAEFGSHRIRLDDKVLGDRPALREYEGRQVVLGIRPEDLADAELEPDAPQDQRIQADVELREALGSTVMVHFPIDAPMVLTEHTEELVGEDIGFAQTGLADAPGKETSTFVAQLDPRTKAAERAPIELVVDTVRMHFFDSDSGLGIYGNGS
jgi:multiple sugar transport system ATP-binding protein